MKKKIGFIVGIGLLFLFLLFYISIILINRCNNSNSLIMKHTYSFSDSYLNKASINDNTKPVGQLYAENSAVPNDTKTNSTFISYSATGNPPLTYFVRTPGSESYINSSDNIHFIEEGIYRFYSMDNDLIQSTISTITIDRTTPSIKLYAETILSNSGNCVNAAFIRCVAVDILSGLTGLFVRLPHTNNYINYTTSTQFVNEGLYSWYAIDKANNSTDIVTLELDRSAPIGKLYNNNSIIKSGSYCANEFKYIAEDCISGVTLAEIKRPNCEWEKYIIGTIIPKNSKNGWYAFRAYDKSGNVSDESKIYLDTSPVSAQLYADEKPMLNGSYTNALRISFTNTDELLDSCYVLLPNATEFVSYNSGAAYSQIGKYEFYAENKAGVRTDIFKIIIDRTNKPLTFENVTNGETNGNVVIGWTDGDADTFAPVKTVTINGKPYTFGSTIYTIDTAAYNVVCVDAAGNTWSGTFTSMRENVPTKTINKEWWESKDGADNVFAFATYDNSLNFAIAREKAYVRNGVWNNAEWDTGIAMDSKDSVNAANGNYYIYKKSGDSKTEVAYFTEARLLEVIREYAAIGIKSYFYWQKDPATVANGNNLTQFSDSKTILSNSVNLNEYANYLVDGKLFTGTVYDTEGDHVLTVFDNWGNECEYRLLIIRNAPSMRYALGDGGFNTVTFDRDYYLKKHTTVGITDGLDEFAMFYIFDANGELIAMLNRDDTFALSKAGKYVVQAVNHSGKSQEFFVYISLDTPTIDLIENGDKKQLNIIITQSGDRYAKLTLLEIYKSCDNGRTWVLLTADDYGKTIDLNTYSYNFRTDGIYKVILEDNFRTGIDAVTKQLSYTQADPNGILNGVPDGGITNGSVSFTWTDEAIVILTKDGKIIEYISGKKLTDEGVYALTFKDFNGYEKVYIFTIDTTAPTATIDGATNGDTVNSDVAVTYNESGLSVKLYKDGELIGDYISGTVLIKDGTYRIILSDKAGNETELTFAIDKKVDCTISIYDNGLSNEVVITNGEELTVELFKDGEAADYKFGDSIVAVGKYTITIKDKLGNTVTYNFTIVTSPVKSFEHNFDNVKGLEKVAVNGEEIRLNYGTMYLEQSGTYTVTVTVNGVEYSFEIIIDNLPPTVNLNGVTNGGLTKGAVTITDISEDSSMEVYLGGEKIDYVLGSELTNLGNYKVILTDKTGNITEYNFEIAYSLNGGAVAIILIAILGVAGAAVGIILGKKSIYKKKQKAIEEQEMAATEDENQGEN